MKFAKKQLLELFFLQILEISKNDNFSKKKLKFSPISLLSFEMSFGRMTLFFFPVKAEIPYFLMVELI